MRARTNAWTSSCVARASDAFFLKISLLIKQRIYMFAFFLEGRDQRYMPPPPPTKGDAGWSVRWRSNELSITEKLLAMVATGQLMRLVIDLSGLPPAIALLVRGGHAAASATDASASADTPPPASASSSYAHAPSSLDQTRDANTPWFFFRVREDVAAAPLITPEQDALRMLSNALNQAIRTQST